MPVLYEQSFSDSTTHRFLHQQPSLISIVFLSLSFLISFSSYTEFSSYTLENIDDLWSNDIQLSSDPSKITTTHGHTILCNFSSIFSFFSQPKTVIAYLWKYVVLPSTLILPSLITFANGASMFDCSNVTTDFVLPANGGQNHALGCTYFAGRTLTTVFLNSTSFSAPAAVTMDGGRVNPGNAAGIWLVGRSSKDQVLVSYPVTVTVQNIDFGQNTVLKITGFFPRGSTMTIQNNRFNLTAVNDNLQMGYFPSSSGVKMACAIAIGQQDEESLVLMGSTLWRITNNSLVASPPIDDVIENITAFAVVYVLSANISLSDHSAFLVTNNRLSDSTGYLQCVAWYSTSSFTTLAVVDGSSLDWGGNVVSNSFSFGSATAVLWSFNGSCNFTVTRSSLVQLSNNSLAGGSSSVDQATVRWAASNGATMVISDCSTFEISGNSLSRVKASIDGYAVSGIFLTLALDIRDGSSLLVVGNDVSNSTLLSAVAVSWYSSSGNFEFNLSGRSALSLDGNKVTRVLASGDARAISFATAYGISVCIDTSSELSSSANVLQNITTTLQVVAISFSGENVAVTLARASAFHLKDNVVNQVASNQSIRIISFLSGVDGTVRFKAAWSSQISLNNNSVLGSNATRNAYAVYVLAPQGALFRAEVGSTIDMSNNSVSNTTIIMVSAAVYVDCQQGTSQGAVLVVIAVDKSTFSIVGNRLRHLRRSPDTGGLFAVVVYFNIAMPISAEVNNASRLIVDDNSAADIVGVAQGVYWFALENITLSASNASGISMSNNSVYGSLAFGGDTMAVTLYSALSSVVKASEGSTVRADCNSVTYTRTSAAGSSFAVLIFALDNLHIIASSESHMSFSGNSATNVLASSTLTVVYISGDKKLSILGHSGAHFTLDGNSIMNSTIGGDAQIISFTTSGLLCIRLAGNATFSAAANRVDTLATSGSFVGVNIHAVADGALPSELDINGGSALVIARTRLQELSSPSCVAVSIEGLTAFTARNHSTLIVADSSMWLPNGYPGGSLLSVKVFYLSIGQIILTNSSEFEIYNNEILFVKNSRYSGIVNILLFSLVFGGDWSTDSFSSFVVFGSNVTVVGSVASAALITFKDNQQQQPAIKLGIGCGFHVLENYLSAPALTSSAYVLHIQQPMVISSNASVRVERNSVEVYVGPYANIVMFSSINVDGDYTSLILCHNNFKSSRVGQCPPTSFMFESIKGISGSLRLFSVDSNDLNLAATAPPFKPAMCPWLLISELASIEQVSFSDNHIRVSNATVYVYVIQFREEIDNAFVRINRNVIQFDITAVTQSALMAADTFVYQNTNVEVEDNRFVTATWLGASMAGNNTLLNFGATASSNGLKPTFHMCGNALFGQYIRSFGLAMYPYSLEQYIAPCLKTSSDTASASMSMLAFESRSLIGSHTEALLSPTMLTSNSLTVQASGLQSPSISAIVSATEATSRTPTLTPSSAVCSNAEVCKMITVSTTASGSLNGTAICTEEMQAYEKADSLAISSIANNSLYFPLGSFVGANATAEEEARARNARSYPEATASSHKFGTLLFTIPPALAAAEIHLSSPSNVTTVLQSRWLSNLTLAVDLAIAVLTIPFDFPNSEPSTVSVAALTLSVTATCYVGRVLDSSSSFVNITRIVLLGRPVVREAKPIYARSQTAVAAAQTTGAFAVTAGAIAVPAAALQQGVSLALVRMAQCDEDVVNGESLDVLVHPLRFAVGGGDSRFARGAVLGNLFLIPVAWCVVVYFVAPRAVMWLTSPKRPIALHRDYIGWPGVAVIPFSVLSEGLAMASTGLATNDGSAAGDIIFGCVGLLSCLLLMGAWLGALWLMRARRLVCAPVPRSGLQRVFQARFEWKSLPATPKMEELLLEVGPSDRAGSSFVQQRIVLIGDSWWLWSAALNTALSLVVGVAEGLPVAGDNRLCKGRWVVACMAAVLQALVVLTSTVPLEMLLMGLTGALSCVLVVLVSMATFSDSSGDTAGALNTVTTISSAVGIALMVVGLVGACLEIVSQRRSRLAPKTDYDQPLLSVDRPLVAAATVSDTSSMTLSGSGQAPQPAVTSGANLLSLLEVEMAPVPEPAPAAHSPHQYSTLAPPPQWASILAEAEAIADSRTAIALKSRI